FFHNMHRAGCYFDHRPSATAAAIGACLVVSEQKDNAPQVVLTSLDNLVTQRHASLRQTLRDLRAFWTALPRIAWTRTDALRFFLAYRNATQLDPESKQLAQRLFDSWRVTA